MSKVFIAISLFVTVLISACGSATDTNSNTNQAAGSGNVIVDTNSLPEGLSTSPVPPTGESTPGIPDPRNANTVPKGATPTPGIPDPAELRKPFKPGATPTPGIPSPEEIRRQMQRNSNVDVNAQPSGGDSMMMKRKGARPVNRP